MRFEDGRSGRITCSLLSSTLLSISARVRGDRGELRVFNPVAPHIYHRLRILTPEVRTTERVRGSATYTHQLRAFADAVAGKRSIPTDGTDAVANMTVIDAVYRAAGLMRRGE
jgi:predicted dehydrogenase